MSSVYIVCVILISNTEIALADDRPLSDSSIAGLAFVFGFILLVIVTSICCYCIRKTRQEKDKKRNKKLSEVKKIIEEHYSETNTPFSSETMVSSQKYKDWRVSQPNATIGTQQVVNQTWGYKNQGYVVKTSNGRSISPTRSAPRSPGFERGRSRQRTFVYANQPTYNTLLVKKRSKSAPAYERQVTRHDYVRNLPPRPLVFTKSHFLAIKQPFSKKYLLPPVRTFYTERPMQKRVVEHQRQIVEVPQPPPPPKQEVVKSNVYHVQYHASPNQVVHRTNKFHESDDYQTKTITTNVRTYNEPQHTTYSYGNTYQNYRSYEEPVVRTQVIKTEPQVYSTVHQIGDDQRQSWTGDSAFVNSRVVSYAADDVFIDRSSSYKHSFGKEAKVYNGIGKTKTVEDDFTIVDFVEDGKTSPQIIHTNHTGYAEFVQQGTSAEGTTVGVTVLSTSTPRAPHADSSALNDLDDVLDDHSVHSNPASSSTSSSSSSSSNSSKKEEN